MAMGDNPAMAVVAMAAAAISWSSEGGSCKDGNQRWQATISRRWWWLRWRRWQSTGAMVAVAATGDKATISW